MVENTFVVLVYVTKHDGVRKDSADVFVQMKTTELSIRFCTIIRSFYFMCS